MADVGSFGSLQRAQRPEQSRVQATIRTRWAQVESVRGSALALHGQAIASPLFLRKGPCSLLCACSSRHMVINRDGAVQATAAQQAHNGACGRGEASPGIALPSTLDRPNLEAKMEASIAQIDVPRADHPCKGDRLNFFRVLFGSPRCITSWGSFRAAPKPRSAPLFQRLA